MHAVVYGAVCSDDMTTACAIDTDCTAPATCVLKPTDRQGYLTEPEPMHTYWPFGYNRTTHANWTYGFCPLPPGSNDQCCCETVRGRRVLRGMHDDVPVYVDG